MLHVYIYIDIYRAEIFINVYIYTHILGLKKFRSSVFKVESWGVSFRSSGSGLRVWGLPPRYWKSLNPKPSNPKP